MSMRLIRLLQVLSLLLMWLFVGSVAYWILHLIHMAWQLHDALDASVGISLVAIPLFTTIATVLTYVFIGLQRGSRDPEPEREPEGKSS